MGCPAGKHFRKRKSLVRIIQKRTGGKIDERAWKPTMMTSIYSRCSTWRKAASLRQCDFPVKGISHRVYLCVHMHASSHVRVFIWTTDYAEHCCWPEERKCGRGVAGGAATSLITKQTTTGYLFYMINSCPPLKGCYCETFLFSIS